MADENLADMNEMGSQPDDSDNNDGSDEGLDFEAEAENLVKDSKWFKPEPGTTEITFLNNGREDTREYEGDEREVVVFEIEVDGEEKLWTVNKAQSAVSLYGQLVNVGAARGGLEGETINLIRQGTGSDTTYTVQEAADL